MASKSVRKVETLSVRASRKTKLASTPVDKCVESQNSACELNYSHPLHPTDDRNKYEQQQKLEKTSLSAINSNPLPMTTPLERARRITRSAAENYKRIPTELQMQNEQVTPQDKPITKTTEEHTLKKLTKASSAEQLLSLPPPDLSLTVRKGISRQPESFLSPYSEVRKSYRKVQKRQILSVPYRKCHDVFEGRIVFLINKLQSGKYCAKDLQSLMEKMQKITSKDMMNKYVISGIRTIVNLCKCYQFADSALVSALAKLQQEQTNLKEKVLQELANTLSYHHQPTVQTEEFINCAQYKSQLVRKMYKIYKHQYRQKTNPQIREITLRQCDKLFDLTTTASRVIAILKKQMTLPCQK